MLQHCMLCQLQGSGTQVLPPVMACRADGQPNPAARLQWHHHHRRCHVETRCTSVDPHGLEQCAAAPSPGYPQSIQQAAMDAQQSITYDNRQATQHADNWLLQPVDQASQANSIPPVPSQPNTSTQQPEHSAVVNSSDTYFMQMALEQARAAASQGEIPVGCVLVAADGTVLATSHNMSHTTQNPLAHAEMRAIGQAAERTGAWRLLGSTLYSTLEPCPMCAGAILQARIGRLVYAARQPRLGADGSWVSLFPPPSKPQQHVPKPKTGFPRKPQLTNADGLDPGVGIQGPHLTDPGSPVHIGPDSAGQGPALGDGTTAAAAAPGHDGAQPKPKPHPFHNQIVVERGLLEEDSAQMLKEFFRARRARPSAAATAHARDAEAADTAQSTEL